ncbi:MAG: hypothetical protein IPL35_03320 [Sphingobacteriales bacterium]|nr:hypothetical protein [Sphingobacteriales bacterium]
MYDSKFIQTLKKIHRKDLKRLAAFIESPYFNKKEELLVCFKYLITFYPDFDDLIALSYEKVFEAVLPHTPFSKKEVGYWLSDLNTLLEEFLTIEHLNKKTLLKKTFLLDTYTELGLETSFQKILREANIALEAFPYRNSEYFFYSYLLSVAKNLHFDRQRKHDFDESLQHSTDQLDKYYLSEKLRYSSEIVNRHNLLAHRYQIDAVNELLDSLHDKFYEVPVIGIYAAVLRSLQMQEGNEAAFQQLKTLLLQYDHILPKGEARGLYLYACNYCAIKTHQGILQYGHDMLELYQTMLERDYAYDGSGYLSPWTYTNIIRSSSRLGRLEWGSDFAEQYKERIDPRLRDNCYYFNKAYLCFQDKNYADTLKWLNLVVFDDLFYTCEVKLLMLKVYYTTNETDAFFSLTESFEVYLRRNKVMAANKKTGYMNFVKLVVKIMSVQRGNNTKLSKIEQQVKETEMLVDRLWLIERIHQKK